MANATYRYNDATSSQYANNLPIICSIHIICLILHRLSEWKLRGAVSVDTAEIIPTEPDTGNAGAGIGKPFFVLY